MVSYWAKVYITFSEIKRGMKARLKNVARRIHDALDELRKEWPDKLVLINTHGSMYWREDPPCVNFSYDYNENMVGPIDEKIGNLLSQDEINKFLDLFEKWMEQGTLKLKQIIEEEMKKFNITFTLKKKVLSKPE